MNEYEVTVLLASSSEKTREAVSRELVQKGFSVAGEVKTAGEARQFMEYSAAELVILDLPLKDSPGLEPAYDLGENEFTQVLVLAKNDVYDDNSAALAAKGILSVRKPMERRYFDGVLDIVRANAVKLCRVREQVDNLNFKLEEQHLCDRAKLMLMEKYSMSEQAAHRYIEKTAMDTCRRRREVAERIIEQLSQK